jgi:hypothetical protein
VSRLPRHDQGLEAPAGVEEEQPSCKQPGKVPLTSLFVEGARPFGTYSSSFEVLGQGELRDNSESVPNRITVNRLPVPRQN